MTRERAAEMLRAALSACYRAGVRSLLVIHGQGRHGDGSALLRTAVREGLRRWLDEGTRWFYEVRAGEDDPEQGWNPGTTLVLVRDVSKERLLRVLRPFIWGVARYEKGRNVPEEVLGSPEEVARAIALGFVRRRTP